MQQPDSSESKYRKEDSNKRARRIVFTISKSLWFATFGIARRVSHALAHEMLKKSFEKVLANDCCLPNRIFDLSIKLDIAKGLPTNEAIKLYSERADNWLVRAVVQNLIANYLYLYRVFESERQSIAKRLEIELDGQTRDLGRKKVKGLLSSPDGRKDAEGKEKARQRKKAARQRRKQ